MEGEKADLKLMENLSHIFLGLDYQIWTYKTNIYDLYDRLTNKGEDELGDLDLLNVLKERETDGETRKILEQRYTDVILVFDFDPQDHRYTKEKIVKLKQHFIEATDVGKLFINYPMVESFKHISSLDDPKYMDKIVTMQELREGKYKERVATETIQRDWTKYNKEQIEKIIALNLKKVNYILNKEYKLPKDRDEYFAYNFDEVLNKQIEYLEKDNKFYILNTCIFFVVDYMPSLLEEIKEEEK